MLVKTMTFRSDEGLVILCDMLMAYAMAIHDLERTITNPLNDCVIGFECCTHVDSCKSNMYPSTIFEIINVD
jgi:hypothetical protein